MKADALGLLRKYPVFSGAMVAVVCAAAVGVVDLWRQQRRWRTVAAECERLRIESLTPQVRPEMVAAAEGGPEALRMELAAALGRWPGSEEATAVPDRLEVYAALSAFVERCRGAATAAGIEWAKAERFGFARYAHEAPAAHEAAAEMVRMGVVERALGVLLEAGPQRLCGVTFERSAPQGAPLGNRSETANGVVEHWPVGIEFTGTSECLRRFLNGLVAAGAYVVREVAVAPVERETRAPPGGAAPDGGLRRIAVRLEAVRVRGGTGGAAIEFGPVWVKAGDEGRTLFGAAGGRASRRVATGTVDDWGVELVAVRRAPGRWRLVGHLGDGADGKALLEETTTRRSVRLRVGEADAATGVVLRLLEAARAADGGRVVRVRLQDPVAAREFDLASEGGSAAPERQIAVLRIAGRAETLEVEAGEELSVGGDQLMVDRITEDPPMVEIVRNGRPDQPAERCQLTTRNR